MYFIGMMGELEGPSTTYDLFPHRLRFCPGDTIGIAAARGGHRQTLEVCLETGVCFAEKNKRGRSAFLLMVSECVKSCTSLCPPSTQPFISQFNGVSAKLLPLIEYNMLELPPSTSRCSKHVRTMLPWVGMIAPPSHDNLSGLCILFHQDCAARGCCSRGSRRCRTPFGQPRPVRIGIGGPVRPG